MEDLKSIIAENITALRKGSSMTQIELAEKLNYSDKAISKWERGESVPDITVLKAIADMFGVTVDYLLVREHIVECEEELSEEEKAAFRALDDFTSGENDACVLKITVKATDFKGNERDVVYRFYRYSERRAYVTVEMIDENGSSSERAYGNFDVLYSFVRKVIEDAEKVKNGIPVYSSEKY